MIKLSNRAKWNRVSSSTIFPSNMVSTNQKKKLLINNITTQKADINNINKVVA